MKKIFVMLVALVGFGISATAQTTSSCSYQSGAYVTTEASMHYPGTGSSNKFIRIAVRAYDIESGAVNCTVKFMCSITKQEKTESRTVTFSKQRDGVKGSVDIYGIAPSEITSLKVSNGQCRCND